jgi:hypothetical protein
MSATQRFRLTAPSATELQEQACLFQWAAVSARADPRLAMLFAVPNGTAASSMAEAVRAKKAGRKRGVPDVFLPVRSGCGRYSGLFVELKRKGGRRSDLSEEQAWWLDRLAGQGYKASVAFGWGHAARTIADYLKTPQNPTQEVLEASGQGGESG